ncbi:MAG: hypothetical protein HYU66_14755 [Armatimonadetes bacterium]|nr:hypothetical protein [Armatimonadota bacterium]
MAGLLAGAVRVNTTPPLGIGMYGYAARDHGAEGVHDELFARVLWLESTGTSAVLAACDIGGLTRDVVAAARERIAGEQGLPTERVFLGSTHTHSGPILTGSELEQRYADSLVDKLTGAAAWARSTARPARLAHGREPVLYDESGAPLAVLFAHACHAVVMGPENYLISADYPGVAEALVEAETGCPALFLQACGADVNPHPRIGFECVELHGKRLGHAVLKHLTELPAPAEVSRLVAEERPFELPLEDLPGSLDEARERLVQAEEKLAAAEAESDRPGPLYWPRRAAREARELVAALDDGGAIGGLPFAAHRLQLNGFALLGWPAEVLSPVGAAVEAASPHEHTVSLGYLNGVYGYLPDAVVWDEQGYEYQARMRHLGLPIARSSAEVAVREALALLRR